MNKLISIAIILSLTVTLKAQVGINTQNPDESSVLDVVSSSKGILIPRMTTTQKMSITKPATGLLVYDTDLKCVSQNIGTPDQPSWLCLSNDTYSNSFYMPSVAIDASKIASNQVLDLYSEYKSQFSTPVKGSDNAPASIPYFSNPSSLYYYITYYDSSVLKINSLSDQGILNYDIIKPSISSSTFMNVVFVVKEQ